MQKKEVSVREFLFNLFYLLKKMVRKSKWLVSPFQIPSKFLFLLGERLFSFFLYHIYFYFYIYIYLFIFTYFILGKLFIIRTVRLSIRFPRKSTGKKEK